MDIEEKKLKIIRPKKSGMYRFLYGGEDVTMEWMEFFSYMSEEQEEDCERLFGVHKKMEEQHLQVYKDQLIKKIEKLKDEMWLEPVKSHPSVYIDQVISIIKEEHV